MLFLKICECYHKVLVVLITLLGLTLLFSVGLQVAGRYVPFIPPYLWPLELTNFALIWSIFIGSAIAVRDDKHFNVDIFQFNGQSIHPALHLFLRALYYFILACITAVFIYYGWLFYRKWGAIQYSDITGINLGWLYISVPFAGVSWLLFLIEGIVREFILHQPLTKAGGTEI